MTEFSDFIRCHRQRLLGVALRLCHGSQDAEDLVQETLMRAHLHFSHLSRMHPNAQRAWLGQTLSRLFIDMYRRGRKEEILPDPTEAAQPTVPETGTAWESISPEELCRAVDRLPPLLAAPLRLRLSGKSYKAIAQEMNASEGTVASWLFQAKKRLRELLMPEGQEVHP